jgi:PAS domain S-box-containing protein
MLSDNERSAQPDPDPPLTNEGEGQSGDDHPGTEAVPPQLDGYAGRPGPVAGAPAAGWPATTAAQAAVVDLSSPLTENSIAGIYIRQGNLIVLCNSRFAELFGYTKDELRGAPLDRVMVVDPFPDGALAATAEHCQTVLNGEVVLGRNRRGQSLWLWTQSWEIEHAGGPATLGNVIDITGQVRSAMALRRSQLELRVLSDELLATQENERKRIAGELHDGLGQQLTAIKFGVQSMLSELRPQLPETYIERLGRIVDRVQDAVEEVRRISMALRPSMLDDLGIIATLSWFCREFQTVFRDVEVVRQVEVSEEDVHDTLKVVIFRILQETFNNIGKHAQARRAQLRLERHRDRIRLMIADDGCGFDPVECAKERRGFGLNGMRERARLSGGRLRIMSRPGRGTLVLAVWKMRD